MLDTALKFAQELKHAYDGELWLDESRETVVASYDDMVARYGEDFEEDNGGAFVRCDLFEWINRNTYDMRFVLNRDKTYNSAKIMVSGGGPTVWISTENSQVEVYGAADMVAVNIPGKICDEIDGILMDCYYAD